MKHVVPSLKLCILLATAFVTRDNPSGAAAQQPQAKPVIKFENPFDRSVKIAIKCVTHDSWVDGRNDGQRPSWINLPGGSTGVDAIKKTFPHDGDFRFVVRNNDGSQRHTETVNIQGAAKITLKWRWLAGDPDPRQRTWEYYFDIEDED